MSFSDNARRQSAQRARALLAVLDIQPPPDFAVQVLARVYALQARRAARPAPFACPPLPSQQSTRGWRRTCWPVRSRSRLSGLRTVTYGLVVASAVLLWCVSMRMLPAALPEAGMQICTTLQHDTTHIGDDLDGTARSAMVLQEVAAVADPGLQPSTLAPRSRETQMDEADLARKEEHAVRPAAPMAPGLPVWSREVPKLSVQTQEQRSARQRGVRNKAKRSGKGPRLSRHVPA